MAEGSRESPFLFYLGLGLTTGATLALEIVQTRILSVVSWYHLAFFVISIAMFGMTIGALAVFLRPAAFLPGHAMRSLTRLGLLAAIATALAYLDQICLAPEMVMSATTMVIFTRLALSVAVPFFFTGAAVTVALTRSAYPTSRAYGADLLGAAAGCVLVIPLLAYLGGPGAVFASAALMSAGAWCFARAGGEKPLARRALALVVALIAIGWSSSRTTYGLEPILVKGLVEKRQYIAYEQWNSFSRVTAYQTVTDAPGPVMWASSLRTPRDSVEFVMMNIDGLAGTVLFHMAGDPARVQFLRDDATTMAYTIRKGSVAVIGVGGGKDLMAALAFGNPRVLGVELNPALTHMLLGPYRKFAGLADHPNVRLVTDEARSYMTRSREKFDIIQASLIDTWAATGAGAFSLSENAIYTVEAWKIFLSRLSEGGVFTVSRWYAPDRLDETARLVSLAAAALYATGARDPASQMMLGAHGRIATLLVSNRPFSTEDVTGLRRWCDTMGFQVVFAPGMPPKNETLARMLSARSAADLERIGRTTALDLTPPTDSRPFFFNLLRLSRPWAIIGYLGRPSGVVTGNLLATVTLLTIIGVTLLLGAATVWIPRRFTRADARPPGSAIAYFTVIGFGFMFIEIAFLQRLSVFLGHPVYSLSVVLFSLILFTGVGSFASEKIRLETPAAFVTYAALLVGYIAALAIFLPRITVAFQFLEFPGRAALSVALIAPAGFLMGQAFPAGMKLARAAAAPDTDPTPWLFGVNGAAGVFASALAVATSIAAGINRLFVLAAFCYLALIPISAMLARRRRGQPHEALPRDSPA